MPRPNSAHVLSSQLEQAMSFYASKGVPGPAVSPASSTAFDRDPFDMLATSSISHSSTSPLYPSTLSTAAEPLANGVVVGEDTQPPHSSVPAPTKPTARLHSRSADHAEDEDVTDDEFEAELNDFGYGARPRKQKEKKESLLDILNSEPPPWLTRPPIPLEPLDFEPTPSIESKRSLTAKLRRRLRASTTSAKAPATPAADPTGGLTTLRSSRSSGNLLSGFSLRSRGKTSNAPAPHVTTAGPPPPQMLPFDLPSLAMPSSPAQTAPTSGRVKRLAAKSAATSKESSTRDLVDFLNSDSPAASRGFGHSPVNRPSLPLSRRTESSQPQRLANKQSAPAFTRSATFQGLSRSAGPAYRDAQPLSAPPRHSAALGSPHTAYEHQTPHQSDQAPPRAPPTYRRRSIAAETAFLRADSGDSVISFASIQRTPPRAPPARRISRKPVPSVIIDQLDDLRRSVSYSASTDAFDAAAAHVRHQTADDDDTVEYVESPQEEQRRGSYPNFRDSFCTAASTSVSSAGSHGSQRVAESKQPNENGTSDRRDGDLVEQLRRLQRQLEDVLSSSALETSVQNRDFERSLAHLAGLLRSASEAVDRRVRTESA